MSKLEIKKLKIKDLKPYSNNPRKNDAAVAVVAKSIKEFGFNVPILLDKANRIIAGHTRAKAAMKIGLTEVPVIWLENLNEEQVKAFRIMDNKSQEYAQWDDDLLKTEFFDLKDKGFDLDLTGFSETELGKIMGDDSKEEPVPEGVKYEIHIEDLYELENNGLKHYVYCGDATEKKDVDKLLNGTKIDMVFTDPPYGLGGYAGRSGKFEGIKGDEVDVTKFYNCIPRDVKERYVWGNYQVLMNLTEVPRDVIVWVKDNFGMGRGYRGQYEMCFYYGSFAGSDSDVWEIPKDNVNEYKHPTQKPTALCKRALKNSSKKKDNILDIFGGSGNTLIACEQTGRNCFMMELDEDYCSKIIERWENLTGKKAKKIGGQ